MGARPHMEGHWRHLAAPPLQQQAASQPQQQQQEPPQPGATASDFRPNRLAHDAAQPSGGAGPSQAQQPPQPWVAAGQPQLTLAQRFTAAAGASLVSALVVNPLDVVKTRLQAQSVGVGGGKPPALQPSRLLDKWGFISCHAAPCGECPPGDCRTGTNPGGRAAQPPKPPAQPSSFALMRTIARSEGPMALWRGTSAALLMAVPMVGIYFPLYDALAADLAKGPAGAQAPLIAGAVARTAAVLCTSPLELVRTRMQAALHLTEPATAGIAAAGAGTANATARLPSMWAHLPAAASAGMRGRVAALWTGVGATLARDVPFSALYWQLLEPIRAAMLPSPQHGFGQRHQHQQHQQAVSSNSDQISRGGGGGDHDDSIGANSVHTASGQPASRRQIVFANLVAGSTAGAVAAAVTTPLDVVKTRAQLAAGGSGSSSGGPGGGGGSGGSIRASLRAIHADSGVRGLFSGVGPRAVRAAPACAIVVASYEAIKSLYAQQSDEGRV